MNKNNKNLIDKGYLTFEVIYKNNINNGVMIFWRDEVFTTSYFNY